MVDPFFDRLTTDQVLGNSIQFCLVNIIIPNAIGLHTNQWSEYLQAPKLLARARLTLRDEYSISPSDLSLGFRRIAQSSEQPQN